MAFSVTDIITDYGNYYEKAGQNMQRIKDGLFQAPETLNIPGITTISQNDTIYRMANPIQTSVLQGYQKAFTPKGSVEFHPNEIRLQHCKIDNSFVPHEIEESWLGFLAGNSMTTKDWPIAKYIIEQCLLRQLNEDKENDVVYNGRYQAPESGTANAASQVMDGFKVQLEKGAQDSKYPIHIINSIGELTVDDCFDQVEEFVSKLPVKARNLPLILFISPEMYTAYMRIKRNRGLYDIKSDTEIGSRVDFTKCVLRQVASMSGSTDLWATLPQNIVHVKKREFSTGNVLVQQDKRDVNVLIDWFEAIGFATNDLVFATHNTISGVAVANPTFSVNSNNVTMATTTAGATIYYTTDGSTPTTSSTRYTSAVAIQADTTFKAIAVKSGKVSSDIVVETIEHSA